MSWKRVSKSAFHVTAASTSLALFQWLVMSLVGHIEGPGRLGEYALSVAIATPASYLSWLSLRQQLIASATDGADFSDFICLRICAPAIVFVSAGCVLAALLPSNSSLFYICISTFLAKYVEGFFDLAYGKMQAREATAELAATNLVRLIVAMGAFGPTYLASHNLPLAINLTSIASLAVFWLQRNRLEIKLEWSKIFRTTPAVVQRRSELAYKLLPLALSNVLMSAVVSAPRIIMNHVVGPVELGLFAAVMNFVAMASLVATAIGHAILPHLATAYRRHQQAVFWRALIAPMMLIAICSLLAATAALFIGDNLLSWVYGRGFSSAGSSLVDGALASGPVLCASIAYIGCYAAQMRKELLLVQLVSLCLVTSLTYYLLPSMAIRGAFLAIGLTGVVQNIICFSILFAHWRRMVGAKRKIEQ